jgi:hypothetical protein
MAAPFEIIAAPLELYIAPTGTAFPAIDDDETTILAGDWALVGKSGSRNYSDDGVSVKHGQTIASFTPAGATVPRKFWRTAESLDISVTIMDLTVEAYASALNDAAITTVVASTGIAGEKSIELFQGDQVKTHALLARGLSPYLDGMFAQYEVPIVVNNSDSTEIVFNKGVPAGITLAFSAASDDTGDFGVYRAGTAVAL